MKKTAKTFSISSLLLLSCAALSGCSSNSDVLILKALNCEDYIGEDAFSFTYEDEQGNEVTLDFEDVLSGFETYESEKLGKKVQVVYDTYDTNETMLASLKTGKTSYDLILASDYTIQKMMSMDMLQKIDLSRVPNYANYASPYLIEVTENIQADINGSMEKMSDYSIGYMWGTLGILFNSDKVASDKSLDPDEVKFDMASWSSLWDEKYRNEMSVKDSMRDTYSVGIMHRYEEEILADMTASGCFDMESGDYALLDGKYETALGDYHGKLTEIFNRCDKDAVNEVKEDLLKLKENVFGFEVDSGKDDMVKGLIGMNLAWSGDAVYSIDRGENEAGTTLYYSVPKTGGNIWFDSWSIPKDSDAEHKACAEDFLDFISDPQVAAANMETIGYTSFIAGETVHELIRLWYDPRSYAMYVYDEADWWEDNDFHYRSYDEEGNPIDDGYVYDDELDIAYLPGFDVDGDIAEFDIADGLFDMAGSSFETAVLDGVVTPWEDYVEAYNERAALINAKIEAYNETVSEKDAIELVEELDDWTIRDLSYMFAGTIDPGDEASFLPGENGFLFYSDEIETVEVDGLEVSVGRQFVAQYPDKNMIPKLAVMRDYGQNNIYVLEMWSDVKSNNLPLAAVIVFGILLAGAAVGIIAYYVTKHHFHSYKVKRRKALNEALAKKN